MPEDNASAASQNYVLQNNPTAEAFPVQRTAAAEADFSLPHLRPGLRLLETVREYAEERLAAHGELEAVRQRHAASYLALAETAEPELEGAEQQAWHNRLERDHDNLRAALDWALARGAAATAGRLAGALWRFWFVHGHLSEGRRYLEQVLALGEAAPAPARVKVLNGAGALAFYQEDFAPARARFADSLALARELGDQSSMARALVNLATTLSRVQDHEAEAQAHLTESHAIYRELGDRSGMAYTTQTLGDLAYYRGDYTLAQSRYAESLALNRALGDRHSIAVLLHDLGGVAREQGDYARARPFLQESLALFRELQGKYGEAITLANLADVVWEQGRDRQARLLYAESLALLQELGAATNEVARALIGLAELALFSERAERTARLLGAVAAQVAAGQAQLPGFQRAKFERTLAGVRAQLPEALFAAAWSAGRALSLDRAIALATAETEPG